MTPVSYPCEIISQSLQERLLGKQESCTKTEKLKTQTQNILKIQMANRTVHIRHQFRKTTVLSCHRCLINTGAERVNNIKYRWPLTTRFLKVRVNVGTKTIVFIFKACFSIQRKILSLIIPKLMTFVLWNSKIKLFFHS